MRILEETAAMAPPENTKINKSLYALQNVVLALNLNESRVPYRESKLTRVLQESLGVTSKILMVTCLVRLCFNLPIQFMVHQLVRVFIALILTIYKCRTHHFA